MILRSTNSSIFLRSNLLSPLLLRPSPTAATRSPAKPPPNRQSHRHLHRSLPLPPVPPPTAFVPDANTFLSLIGRSLSSHAAKIPSWEALFSLSSTQLRELGVEPARARRYLLWWRDRFRRGIYGPGGELRVVVDGVAEVRIVEMVETGRQTLVNVTPETTAEEAETVAEEQMVKAEAEKDAETAVRDGDGGEGLRHGGITSARIRIPGLVVGTGFKLVKGSKMRAARITVEEGLWEERRGHKVHGGERRRKNVLSRLAAKARGTLK